MGGKRVRWRGGERVGEAKTGTERGEQERLWERKREGRGGEGEREE